MVTVLDNLHHQKLIEPTIAVFVSPLDPENLDFNRRMDEMGNNQDYISFFIGELIPKVESEYKISSDRTNRAILGTSLGGLNATYFGFTLLICSKKLLFRLLPIGIAMKSMIL